MTSTIKHTSIIKTYSGEMYIVKGQTPAQVQAAIQGMEWVTMPNGDQVRPAHIASIVSRDSYRWQEDQKSRHKKGQHIYGGEWHDGSGSVGTAALGAVMGGLALPDKRIEA